MDNNEKRNCLISGKKDDECSLKQMHLVFDSPFIEGLIFSDDTVALNFLIAHCVTLCEKNGQENLEKEKENIRLILETYKKISSVDFLDSPSSVYYFALNGSTCTKE